MNADIEIPAPPNALIVAMHIHTQKCMGIVTVAFDRDGHKVPMWAKEKITAYQLWDGANFQVCSRRLCDFRWYMQ